MMKPSLESIYMNLAFLLSERSLDDVKVGCVITDETLQHVLGIGYNAGAKGQSDKRKSNVPGKGELIHAEVNSLIKCNTLVPNKVVFVTHEPCITCSKLLVNAGIKKLYYSKEYRNNGISILKKAGIEVEKYENIL